jgi:hypothetical protein
MMATTFRMYLRGRKGRCVENFRTPQITANSVVHISVSEATELSQGTFTPVFGRFVGDANITVHNVSPSDGRVDFVVTVDFFAPLNIVTDITIFDPPAEVVVGV